VVLIDVFKDFNLCGIGEVVGCGGAIAVLVGGAINPRARWQGQLTASLTVVSLFRLSMLGDRCFSKIIDKRVGCGVVIPITL
jgi:hypothetical protein